MYSVTIDISGSGMSWANGGVGSAGHRLLEPRSDAGSSSSYGFAPSATCCGKIVLLSMTRKFC
jgi:hypothetical protein